MLAVAIGWKVDEVLELDTGAAKLLRCRGSSLKGL